MSKSFKSSSTSSTSSPSSPAQTDDGLSTYLYSEHRFREPHEYRDFWKGPSYQEQIAELIRELENTRRALKKANKEKKRFKKHLDNQTHPKIETLTQQCEELQQAIVEKEKALMVFRDETEQSQKQLLQKIAEAAVEKKEISDKLGGQILAKTEQIFTLEAVCKLYQDSGKQVVDLLLEFGSHKTECDIWDLRSSGRLVDMDESEVCTCDWSKAKTLVSNAKDRGEAGQFSEEDVKQLIDQYKQE